MRFDRRFARHAGQHQRCYEHYQNGLEDSQHQHAYGGPAHGYAQYAAVCEPLGAVYGLFKKGRGVADAFAVAILKRLALSQCGRRGFQGFQRPYGCRI